MCSTKKLETGGNLKISDCHDVTCVDSVDYRELQRETGHGQDPAQTSQSGSRVSSAVKTFLRKAGECGFPGIDPLQLLCGIQLTPTFQISSSLCVLARKLGRHESEETKFD